ncbi:MAG: hypothetical protein D3923_14585 [Candidatus Electrothrix sp. AR3]|nr:hypothetical protein [Candidatus Electrothrix sp. AR3]
MYNNTFSKGVIAMGDITIRIPQKVHIEYTLKSAQLTRRILDILNAMIIRDDTSTKQEPDSDQFSDMSPERPRLGDLALKLFGADAGIELDLLRHTSHEALEFDE